MKCFSETDKEYRKAWETMSHFRNSGINRLEGHEACWGSGGGGGYSVAKSCPAVATPWTAAHQASLFFSISQSLLTLMSGESMMPSKHLTLCHLLFLPSIFPSIRVFSSESKLFTSSGQSIGASASTDWLQLIINSWAKGLYFTYYYISNSK